MEPTKRAPAFQLYPQDFISSLDVQMMSAAEVGAYCLLLFNSWGQNRQGYLPNDEAQLQFMSRLTADQWKQSKKKLLAKFPLTADKKMRYNPRLVSEVEKQEAFRQKQAENGKRGGRPRRDEVSGSRTDSSGQTQENPSLSQPLEVANPTPKPKKALLSSSSSSFSSSEETDSLRSSDAATAAAPADEENEGGDVENAEPITPESPTASATHTGGANDVGTPMKASRGGGRFVAPTQQQVQDLIAEKRPRNPGCWEREAERFIDYYTSNGWKVGKNPMKDWPAAVRNWLQKVPEVGPAAAANGPAVVLPVPAFQQQRVSQVQHRQGLAAQLYNEFNPEG